MAVSTIVYFKNPGGREPVRVFLDDLPPLAKALCEQVIDYLATGEIDQRPRHRSHIGGNLWELRISFQRVEYRILYAMSGNSAVLLHAFKKKQQTTPKRALETALERWKRYDHEGGSQ